MSKLSLLFARRYLFSKKSHSVINIISGVSIFAVSVPVAAMVLLLSVFNGFDSLIRSMNSSFDPDISVSPRTGKVFIADSLTDARIRSVEGVAEISFVLDENALFEYRDRQYIGMLRGVDSLYEQVVPIGEMAAQGEFRLRLGDFQEAYLGQGVAYALGVRTALEERLSVYVPRRGNLSPLLPQSIYRREEVYPSGTFVLDAETDGQYVFVTIDLARRLLDYPQGASSVAVRLEPGASAERVAEKLATELGDGFRVLTRDQQNETYYRIMMYEKWGIYFIILLVLIVASFSLVGSLAMLIIEKRKDARTLVTLGGDLGFVRRIFVTEGMLIYGTGAFAGLIFGLLLSLGQQHFGWIRMGGETFVIDAYPVEVHGTDLLWVVLTFTLVSWTISQLTTRAMIPAETIRPAEENQ